MRLEARPILGHREGVKHKEGNQPKAILSAVSYQVIDLQEPRDLLMGDLGLPGKYGSCLKAGVENAETFQCSF